MLSVWDFLTRQFKNFLTKPSSGRRQLCCNLLASILQENLFFFYNRKYWLFYPRCLSKVKWWIVVVVDTVRCKAGTMKVMKKNKHKSRKYRETNWDLQNDGRPERTEKIKTGWFFGGKCLWWFSTSLSLRTLKGTRQKLSKGRDPNPVISLLPGARTLPLHYRGHNANPWHWAIWDAQLPR